MKIPALFLSGLIALSVPAFSQNNQTGENTSDPDDNQNTPTEPTDQEGRKGFWEANIGDGNYLVALGRISSVSRHKYVLDGALIVDEVTVDTTGQALVRFYHIEPITAGVSGAAAAQVADRALGLIEGAAQSAGSDLQSMVQKKYPLTTHSKTIEYRVLSEAQLGVLYQSVKTAWVTGQGRVFTGL